MIWISSKQLAAPVSVLHMGRMLKQGSIDEVRNDPQVKVSLSWAGRGSARLLKLEDVGAAYGASPVLTGIRLEIDQARPVALLGRNGVGKTTLLRTIAGLHRASGGNINFAGEDVTALSAYERARRGIALVPQGRGIFPHLTVEENLTLGLSSLAGRNTPIRRFSHLSMICFRCW